MFINLIDELFDKIIDRFYIYIKKKSIIKKFINDINFVKYHNQIINIIKDFSNTIKLKEIKDITDIKNFDIILNIIKRYIAFYLFFTISYYYKGSRDTFITNLIELSRDQSISTFKIDNFFNSDNNSKIIHFFSIIKQIIQLQNYKTIDKIKIILKNKPVYFQSTINFLDKLGEDYIIKNFLIKNNFHNLLKTIIFKFIYVNEEKNDIISILSDEEKNESKYKYIEIVVSKYDKIVDFNIIKNYLISENKNILAEEFYSYLEENKKKLKYNYKKSNDYSDFLFSNKKLIPIVEDFLRYHKKTEKYGKIEDIKERDSTKIKYIIQKINKVQNYYSEIYKKNLKFKIEVDQKFFFKQFNNRKVILYNDNEEVKIIRKLNDSDITSDLDLKDDLENFRKYSYLNFKDFDNDGFKLRPSKTIKSIRITNLKSNKKDKIETRITNSNIDTNVVGIALNPNNISFNCLKNENMVDVKTLFNKNNGFNSFKKLIMDIKNTKGKNIIYYWIFDTKNDLVKLNKYRNVSSLDKKKIIDVMIHELYKEYENSMKNKFLDNIKSLKEINIWKINKLFRLFKKKYFNFDFNNNLKNDIINKSINYIKENNIEDDDIDSIIPGKSGEIIKLPIVNFEKNKNNIIILGEKKLKEINYNYEKKSICLHHIKWNRIKYNRNDDERNQKIYDFVKQYVTENKNGEIVCKSCSEILNLKKYVYEGTFIKELDVYMTTSLEVQGNLNEIAKYSNLTRTIRNMEKNIEKICYSANIESYLGNYPINKLQRKLLIKETIDLILIHTEYIKNQPKNRREIYSKKYNINKDLTNLFFFPLKDDIFLTSSEDTDYYKIIKFNNVIAYMTFILITQMNSGQIINLNNDKRCNHFIYSKFGKNFTKDLFIRINEKEKIKLEKLPILSYIIYYISCLLSNNDIWLWKKSDDNRKKIKFVQLNIIHTVVDLINTVMDASFIKGQKYLYELITTRFIIKNKTIFKDENLNKIIEQKNLEKIKIDKDSKKILFVTKKIKNILLDGSYKNYKIKEYQSKLCDSDTFFVSKRIIKKDTNNVNLLTNCLDGKFHNWELNNGKIICKLCNKSYDELIKLNKTTSEENINNVLDKIKLDYLRKIAKNYCISGKLHDINLDTNKCILCKIDPKIYKFTNKELYKLEKNITNNNNDKNLKNINKMKKIKEKIEEKENKYKNEIKNLNNSFEKNTKNILVNFVNDFIDKLSKNLGKKIKLKDEIIYLKDTIYEINNNHYGFESKKKIIFSSDDKIKFEENNDFFKIDVLYFKDTSKKISFYYSAVTKQYLGYAENYKKFKKVRSKQFLKITYSIKDMILMLGLENRYENLNNFNSNFDRMNKEEIKKSIPKILKMITRKRINNLKYIINKSMRIIYSIKYNFKKFGIYNNEEKKIINQFKKSIRNININNKDKIFNNKETIINKVNINKLPTTLNYKHTKNYINTNILNNINNYDIKIIYYYISEIQKLLLNTNNTVQKTNLSYFIIKIIKHSFHSIYMKNDNSEFRKFESLIFNKNPPPVNEFYNPKGIYSDILNTEEIDDDTKTYGTDDLNYSNEQEIEYSAKQAFDSFDIDDYNDRFDDNNDSQDYDYSAEALN